MNAFINRIYETITVYFEGGLLQHGTQRPVEPISKTITGYFEGGYCNNCNSEYTGSACPRCG